MPYVFSTRRVHGRLEKEMVVLENPPKIARFVMMKKTAAASKAKRIEIWIDMRPASLIAVRERMLESYSD